MIETVAVVGAGIGGFRACEALRREGFAGRLVLVGDEPHAPYDRTPLSKGVLLGTRTTESLAFAQGERLAALGLELRTGERALALDLEARRVELEGGALDYDGLILAPGASPRRLALLDGRPDVHVLRRIEDGVALETALGRGGDVVVIGAGFIGSEVAASARRRGCGVTIVELEATPLARAVGPELADVLVGLHREHGTALRLGVSVVEAAGDGPLRLALSDGTQLVADTVVVGVGVFPNTGWLDGSGLEIGDGIVCDASLRAAPGVFAVGDAASWHNELFDRRQRVEHWMSSGEQGRHAAHQLLHGAAEPFTGSNYVWSDQYDRKIMCAGVCTTGEVELVHGSIESGAFVAWYRHEDRLFGALAIGEPKLLAASRALIEQRAGWDEARAALAAELV